MTALMWVQIFVVVVGTAWVLALIGITCVGGWYARTHPTAGNDQAFQRIARLLRLLTFGLTGVPFPQPAPSDPDPETDWRSGTPAALRRNPRDR